jgi:hypothetical protein
LNPLVVDERAVPQLEVEETPDPIAAVGTAVGVIAKQSIDGRWIDDPAVARA